MDLSHLPKDVENLINRYVLELYKAEHVRKFKKSLELIGYVFMDRQKIDMYGKVGTRVLWSWINFNASYATNGIESLRMHRRYKNHLIVAFYDLTGTLDYLKIYYK